MSSMGTMRRTQQFFFIAFLSFVAGLIQYLRLFTTDAFNQCGSMKLNLMDCIINVMVNS